MQPKAKNNNNKKMCGHIFIKTANKVPSGINFEDYFLER